MKSVFLKTVFLFSCFHFFVYAYPGGQSGYTLKSGTAGCGCHGGSYFNTSVLVKITGPDTLAPSAVGNYTLTISGGPSTSGGLDIAASTGTLAPVSSTIKLLNGELTQKSPIAYSGGSITVNFTYAAPATPGTQTLYATGSSKKYWNWAPNKPVVVAAAGQSASIAYGTGWNLLSVPLAAANMSVSALFPAANTPAYAYNNGYATFTTLANGTGYWIRFPAGGNAPVTGQSLGNSIPLSAGWNLIGAGSTVVPVSGITTNPANIITSQFYSYSGGYTNAQTLAPGSGYWVRASQAGTLNYTGGVDKAANLYSVQSELKITLTDADGKSAELLLVRSNANVADLPPLPPPGVFDVRFASGRNADCIAEGAKILTIQGARYPVQIAAHGTAIRLRDAATYGSLLNTGVKSGESITITNAGIAAVEMTPDAQERSFSLEQNYPNPFNPATTIRYTVPAEGLVILKVYDALGAETAALVNERLSAGTYSVSFNAGALPGGIYFYKLTAGGFTEIRKMTFLR